MSLLFDDYREHDEVLSPLRYPTSRYHFRGVGRQQHPFRASHFFDNYFEDSDDDYDAFMVDSLLRAKLHQHQQQQQQQLRRAFIHSQPSRRAIVYEDDGDEEDFVTFPSAAIKKRKRHSGPSTISIQDHAKRQQKQVSFHDPPNNDTYKVSKRPMKQHEMNEAVRDSVFTFFDSVHNVPADGNCGYYVLYDFLQDHGLLPKSCRNITGLRRIIYNFALEHKEELLAQGSYFTRLGYWRVYKDPTGERSEQVFLQDISKIYSEGVCFEGGCSGEYWMNANIVMPLVAMLFDINIWLLSADGDPFCDPETGRKVNDQPYTTMYNLTTEQDKRDIQREIVRGSVAFPVHSSKDGSSKRETAFVIHVDGNHYISAQK